MNPIAVITRSRAFWMPLVLTLCLGLAALTALRPGIAAQEEAKPVEKVLTDRNPMPEGWKAPDLAEALERARQPKEFVRDVLIEDPALRQQRLRDLGLGMKDMKTSYVELDSPLVNTYEDKYGPVRFMHGKHAAVLDGNCALCHHYKPAGENAPEIVACRACHQESFKPETPERIGLKAAYHLQCVNCHEDMKKGPVSCDSCHKRHVPDHKDLVQLPADPTPTQVTQECLRCHPKAGEDMLTSAHWLWRGPSPYTVRDQKKIMSGKATNTVNNFCISVPSNEPRCTSCHAGYGWKDNTFDFTDQSRIDCLVCHDATGSYVKAPPKAGMPDPKVDLVYVAKNVSRSTRSTCGECHFQGGGGDAVKHADMCGVLHYPQRNCDVHMGGYDFSCVECHTTKNHKIRGRSSSAPVAEGSRSCTDCHSDHPHYGDSLLDHHLNKHCDNIACNTCHSPVYSKCKATKTWWDWSTAGDKEREVKKDKYGMPDYNWMKGEFGWQESAKPTYAWYNGYFERVLLGDKVDTAGALVTPDMTMEEKQNGRYVDITVPLGGIKDPGSRITPFKVMRGVQPVDAKHDYLIAPHLFPSDKDDKTAYWKGLDWKVAMEVGMQAAGLPFSGEWKWLRTSMYWRIEHEVMPAESALSCVNCHDSLQGEKTCDRCHQDNRNMDFRKLSTKGVDFAYMAEQGRDVKNLVGSTDYIDFKALGYPGDPILNGGRFKQLPLGQETAQNQ